MTINIKGELIDLSKPKIMGILNLMGLAQLRAGESRRAGSGSGGAGGGWNRERRGGSGWGGGGGRSGRGGRGAGRQTYWCL